MKDKDWIIDIAEDCGCVREITTKGEILHIVHFPTLNKAIRQEIDKRIPKEKEVIQYKSCKTCGGRWINEEDKGRNQAIQECRKALI